MLKRDPEGKFLESPDSLYRKTIGLRVSKSIYPKLEELSQKTGKSMAEIARDAVHEYIERLEQEKQTTKKTNQN
ncbi:MAG: ribbon-helix-helix protein, CopG family [Crocosphaera sp.]